MAREFIDSELRKLAESTGVSGGVVRTIIEQARVGTVTSWGNTTYMFRELLRQTFDPTQIRTVPVAVNDHLHSTSYETDEGEVFYRDRTKDVPATRFEQELSKEKAAGVQVLVEKGTSG